MGYSPQQRLAARAIASLLAPDWPGGPDLDPPAFNDIWGDAVKAVQEPYYLADRLAEKTGKVYDRAGDAATAWEMLRSASTPDAPYSAIDPLIRDLLAEVDSTPARPARRRRASTEYTVAAPEQLTESALILEKLKAMGYSFRLNLCTDTIEIDDRPISDVVRAIIRVKLRDIGMHKQLAAAEDAYTAEAERNAYHPVRDYLSGLKWDNEDHFATLADCLHSDDPPIVYPDGTTVALCSVYLYRWMIGAVAKVLDCEQNVMLVLDGPQGIGKSTLVRWLCSGLPKFFIEGPINVADKDTDVRLLDRWIWEVSELDATTRKSDQSAIKAFITKREVTVRKAYGRHDITKPAMASQVGTVNNSTGFLADETGSRRFYITRLEKIDMEYQQIDVNQLWAQIVALYRDGEPWKLRGVEVEAQARRNEGYEIGTVLDDYIEKYYSFDPAYSDPMTLGDIVADLAAADIRLSGTERMQHMELARVLTRRGAQKVHTRAGKRWVGLFKKSL